MPDRPANARGLGVSCRVSCEPMLAPIETGNLPVRPGRIDSIA